MASEDLLASLPPLPPLSQASGAADSEAPSGSMGFSALPPLSYDDVDGDPDDSDADDSLNPSIKALQEALLNEKAAPELLEFEEAIVSTLLDSVDQQQQTLDSTKWSAQEVLFASLYQMDVDRVKFLIATYLRTRLAKIKQQVLHLLPEAGSKCHLLSATEQRFAEQYKALMFRHFRSSGLDHLPARCSGLHEAEMATAPDLKQWVFCRVKEHVGDYLPGDDDDSTAAEPIQMRKGDAFVLKYSSIRELVMTKAVTLA